MDSAILLIAVLILTAIAITVVFWNWSATDSTPGWNEYRDPRKHPEDYSNDDED